MSDTTPAPIDYDKPSKEIALHQIFLATGWKVPSTKVTLGHASLVDPFPTILVDENSFVPADVSPLEDSRYVGDNGFLYRRLDLSIITPSEEIKSVPLEYPFSTHEALPLLNSLMGTQLDETDVEDDTYTDDTTPVVLRAKPGSVAWIGQKVVNPIDPLARFLVKKPLLQGFVQVNASSPVHPYEGSSQARLTALINLQDNNAFEPLIEGTHFTFGTIATVAGKSYNTRVRIIPVDTETYVEQDIYFTRLDMNVLEGRPSNTITPVDINQVPFTIHGILNEINAALGLNLVASEVANANYSSRLEKYPVQIRPGRSVAWAPSEYWFTPEFIVPIGRELEDGTPRTMEDGSPREMEDPLP